MATSSQFKDFAEEQLSVLGPVTVRSMFGGSGIFHQGMMIALIAYDTLYLKVDDGNRPDFEAEGMMPFTYEGKGKPVRMSYWQAPDWLYDDPDAMREWAGKAFEAARRGKR